MQERSARGPKRQVRRKQKKRGVTHFAESKDTARPNQPRQGAQDANGIGEKLQDETAYGCVKGSVGRNFACIGLGEAHIVQARFSHANSSPGDRLGVALYSNDLSRRTNETGHKQRYVADTGTKVQDTLTGANAGFAEESFRGRLKKCSLSN
jgi:hypothetical protein